MQFIAQTVEEGLHRLADTLLSYYRILIVMTGMYICMHSTLPHMALYTHQVHSPWYTYFPHQLQTNIVIPFIWTLLYPCTFCIYTFTHYVFIQVLCIEFHYIM